MARIFTFVGGLQGVWRIRSQTPWRGPALPTAPRLDVLDGVAEASANVAWRLRGTVSHLRYTTKFDREILGDRQPGLGRHEAVCAALLPIRKSGRWWDLAQDERRAIFEETSHHTAIGLEFLPAVARRLFHSRDLGEPFDFVTWFEFAPEDEPTFDELLARLRATPEWEFVDREVDIRLIREAPSRPLGPG